MHSLVRLPALLTLALLLSACDTRTAEKSAPDEPRRDETVATSGVQTSSADRPARAEQRFEQFATIASHAEIELGRMAQRKAQDPQVERFARQMVNDHTKALQQLQNISDSHGQIHPQGPPTPSQESHGVQHDPLDAEYQQVMDRLGGLAGEEFDREFLRVMVDDHRKAVARFQQQSAAGSRDTATATGGRSGDADARIDEWVKQTLPTIQKHLAMAEQLQSRLTNRRAR